MRSKNISKYQNTQHSAPKWHSVMIYYLQETPNKSRCVFVRSIIHAIEKKETIVHYVWLTWEKRLLAGPVLVKEGKKKKLKGDKNQL